MLLALQILIVLGAIILGARLGSIAIGFAGGLGVLLLSLTGIPVSAEGIPFDVIGIIMCVIAAISAMQLAGGMDYLVHVAERFLRRNPRKITLWAPVITWLMTVLAGTGHTAFSTLPVIVEVAKEGGVRPARCPWPSSPPRWRSSPRRCPRRWYSWRPRSSPSASATSPSSGS